MYLIAGLIIRNALDHGIESPEERRRNKKNIRATIHLQTRCIDKEVEITISDDGRGIDPNLVAVKALEQGLITKKKLSAMTAQEKINLIFLPGFTSKTEVTDLSGRGVGMDTVLDGMNKINGSITITSDIGTGSQVLLRFPSKYVSH